MTTNEQAFVNATRLTRQEPHVNEQEPWRDDRLNRQRAADSLTNLIATQQGPFVVSISGDWGTGKTFFLKRWKQELENNNTRVIYFNAWEDDFIEDPLVAMIAQIIDTVEDDEVRLALSESITSLVYRNVQSVTHKLTGVTLPNFGDDILEAYKSQTKERNKLRNALQKLLTREHAGRVAADVADKTSSQAKLVFIIDELDRCRPDFAIATLERTKHVFDIPGLIFVYGINRREMCKSIASIYGKIDTDVYVRRFFDMEFTLPAVNLHEYCSHMAEQYDMETKLATARLDDGAWFAVAVTEVLSTIGGLSLRDVEQCIRIAAFVIINMARGKGIFDYKAIVAVIVVRLINHDLYQRFARGEHVAGQMIDFLTECTRHSHGVPTWINGIQAPLYAVCDQDGVSKGMTAYHELTQLLANRDRAKPVLLANVTLRLKDEQLGELVKSLAKWLREPSHIGGRILLSGPWRPRLVHLLELAAGA